MNGVHARCVLSVLGVMLISPLAAHAITVEITATVPGCGDGIVVDGEQCDGSNMNGESCSSRGFQSGALSCTAACTLNTVSCTNTSAPVGSGGSSGGSTGGSAGVTNSSPVETLDTIPLTNVVFTGRTTPNRAVTLLKDAQIAATTISAADGSFQMTLSGISGGNYLFGVYAEDGKGNRSPLQTFPITVTAGVITKVGDIVITLPIQVSAPPKGDMSKDGKINLVDFSILAYWYKRPLTSGFKALEAQWLNGDGKINLVDFSILAFYWTG